MTPEAQRIAIHKALGGKTEICPIHLQRECCGNRIPDYLADLNAMHAAEKVLTAEQARTYHDELFKTGNLSRPWMWHSTAAQRAEAFLRTLNLWTP